METRRVEKSFSLLVSQSYYLSLSIFFSLFLFCFSPYLCPLLLSIHILFFSLFVSFFVFTFDSFPFFIFFFSSGKIRLKPGCDALQSLESEVNGLLGKVRENCGKEALGSSLLHTTNYFCFVYFSSNPSLPFPSRPSRPSYPTIRHLSTSSSAL